MYHNNIDALVWLDTSAEQAALYHQAFSLARLRICRFLEKVEMRDKLPGQFCIFTDCDETILDNSAYNAWLVTSGNSFTQQSWNDYCNSKLSKATPGAVEFINWVNTLGISIFFVTSRSNSTRQATAENLRMLGFPDIETNFSENPAETNLFIKYMDDPLTPEKEHWEKWDQYNWITRNRRVEPIIWLGDNLSDFKDYYRTKPWNERTQTALTKDSDLWGEKFIVMPNPVYGAFLRNYFDSQTGTLLTDDNLKKRTQLSPENTPKLRELHIWQPEKD
jgi:5'-nucleotidase (lipoprotein e(P4) family)